MNLTNCHQPMVQAQYGTIQPGSSLSQGNQLVADAAIWRLPYLRCKLHCLPSLPEHLPSRLLLLHRRQPTCAITQSPAAAGSCTSLLPGTHTLVLPPCVQPRGQRMRGECVMKPAEQSWLSTRALQ